MKRGQILDLLAAHGWKFHRRGKGTHTIWRHPSGAQITVPGLASTRDRSHHAKRALVAQISAPDPTRTPEEVTARAT